MFSELVAGLVEALGERMDAARPIDEGLLVRTQDGFLFAFLEDPNRVSLDTVRRLFDEVAPTPARLAVLAPGRLPLAIGTEVLKQGGSLIDGQRFVELARGLGLDQYLGQEPKPTAARESSRLLPSAQQLDVVMGRGRTWLDWGVPALALRFFRQALAQKPEFLPAKVGVGTALLGLGLTDDAERTFQEALGQHPEDVDARIGLASVLGARGKIAEEVAVYREILAGAPSIARVRAHLLAALMFEKNWSEARTEVEAMLTSTPEEPQLRFLHGVSLTESGATAEGEREKQRGRELGLTWDRERALLEHLGLPVPAPPIRGVPSAPTSAPSEVRASAGRRPASVRPRPRRPRTRSARTTGPPTKRRRRTPTGRSGRKRK